MVGRLLAEVASGDHRRGLEALRDELAKAISEVDPDKIAPIAKQLADVMRQLEALSSPKGSKVDDLSARRSARRAASAAE